MAGKYRRRNGKRKAPKYKKKRFVRRNRSVKKLAKTVYKLRKKQAMNHAVMRFKVATVLPTPNGAVPPGYGYLNLTNHNQNSVTPVFSTPNATGLGFGSTKVLHKKITLNCCVDIRGIVIDGVNQSLRDTTQFTVAVVSPKDVNPAFDRATGNISMTADLDYVVNRFINDQGAQQNGGFVLFNLKRWTVHKMKQFTLGNYGQLANVATATTNQTRRTWTWKLYPKQFVQNNMGQVTSSWNALTYNWDPDRNMYVVIFASNGNPIANGQFQVEMLHKYVSLGS